MKDEQAVQSVYIACLTLKLSGPSEIKMRKFLLGIQNHQKRVSCQFYTHLLTVVNQLLEVITYPMRSAENVCE